MKLLIHRETEQVRVLMRRDHTFKVCANHVVPSDLKIEPMAGVCVRERARETESEGKREREREEERERERKTERERERETDRQTDRGRTYVLTSCTVRSQD